MEIALFRLLIEPFQELGLVAIQLRLGNDLPCLEGLFTILVFRKHGRCRCLRFYHCVLTVG